MGHIGLIGPFKGVAFSLTFVFLVYVKLWKCRARYEFTSRLRAHATFHTCSAFTCRHRAHSTFHPRTYTPKYKTRTGKEQGTSCTAGSRLALGKTSGSDCINMSEKYFGKLTDSCTASTMRKDTCNKHIIPSSSSTRVASSKVEHCRPLERNSFKWL